MRFTASTTRKPPLAAFRVWAPCVGLYITPRMAEGLKPWVPRPGLSFCLQLTSSARKQALNTTFVYCRWICFYLFVPPLLLVLLYVCTVCTLDTKDNPPGPKGLMVAVPREKRLDRPGWAETAQRGTKACVSGTYTPINRHLYHPEAILSVTSCRNGPTDENTKVF